MVIQSLHGTARRLARALVVLLVAVAVGSGAFVAAPAMIRASVVTAGPPATACQADPNGDVVATDGAGAPTPAADIVEICGTLDGDLDLSVRLADDRDPATDERWLGDTRLVLLVSMSEDHVDRTVVLERVDDRLRAIVLDADGRRACQTDGEWDGEWVRSGTIPAACLDAPSTVGIAAAMFYDVDPDDPAAALVTDEVPDAGGFIELVVDTGSEETGEDGGDTGSGEGDSGSISGDGGTTTSTPACQTDSDRAVCLTDAGETTGTMPGDDEVTTVVRPSATGNVTIEELDVAGETPPGSHPLPVTVDISAPVGTVDAPIVITFRLPASLVESSERLIVLRNGRVVEACRATGRAVPDPCVASRSIADGEIVVVVLTTTASRWSFAMPLEVCLGAPSADFEDVRGTMHAPAIGCAAHWGLTTGATEAVYDPAGSVSRGQVASFLRRLLAVARVTAAEPTVDAFLDDDGTAHEASIDALASLGVVDGLDSDTYGPAQPVSRGQLAALLVAALDAAGLVVPAGSDDFSDTTGTTHAAAVRSLSGIGIVQGLPDGSYRPGDRVSRAQTASVLARTLQVLADHGVPLDRP